MRAEKSSNTYRAYANGWKLFLDWCAVAQREHLPADAKTVHDFTAWSIDAGYRLQTVTLRLSAIGHYHRAAGWPHPVSKLTWCLMANARREAKERPRGKAALTYDLLSRLIRHFPETPIGIRNRAMVLLAFASGWRRSEIVSLYDADVQTDPRGFLLRLGTSKTDQTGRGRLIGIERGSHPETCPVQALEAWRNVRGIWEGPLFVRFAPGQRMTRLALEPRGEALKDALKAAIVLEGEAAQRYGAHSLRAGMITEAAKHGASDVAIMQRTGHRCFKTLQRYIRPATCFDFNPLRDVL